MQRIIISDTSCLILLDNIGELSLLKKLFGQVVVTDEVVREFGKHLPGWFVVKQPVNRQYQQILEVLLDKGEASSIALAIEHPDSLIILDDYKARNFALKFGLKITGTLGVIIDAKQSGYIDSVKPILQRIKQTDFRMSEQLEEMVLRLANED